MSDFILSEQTGLLHPKSNNKISRRGNLLRSRVTMNQALICGHRGGLFVAVLCDPETGKRLAEVPLWEGKAFESVELKIEWERKNDE